MQITGSLKGGFRNTFEIKQVAESKNLSKKAPPPRILALHLRVPNGVFQISHPGLPQRKTRTERQRMPEKKTPVFSSILVHYALADPDHPLNTTF